jgi:prepilin-type N-terminal cleavage/methylation domain-containing protein/prepilin-type processing-associated H-X9-DG protein
MEATASNRRIWEAFPSTFCSYRRRGFTLVELLVVIAISGLLAALLFPSLGRANGRGKATFCFNNMRQLGVALHIYAGDYDDELPPNAGVDGIHRTVASGEYRNWVNNVMSWELDSDNTNTTLLTIGGLGPYVGQVAKIFKCPSDTALSKVQRDAGWTERVRSVSMNAMLGDAGEFMKAQVNTNNPHYRQFLRVGDVEQPSGIFAFIEEHPDSINDGYFINRFYSTKWIDLPASYHNGGANIAYVDGHVEWHGWKFASTKPPGQPDAAGLPFQISSGELGDFNWLLSRTSVYSYPESTESDSDSDSDY